MSFTKPIDRVQLGRSWVAAWNSRSLPTIMSHYSPLLTSYASPNITRIHESSNGLFGAASGKLSTFAEVETYFSYALEKLGETLKFELIQVFGGTDEGDVAIIYRRETGTLVIEKFWIGEDGKVGRVECFYGVDNVGDNAGE